ncbi:MAG: ABC transporter ATP-binding protein [Melioribacteraceae bacterium]|nr:ABC transporter ATP-binding protein [Melioribacteraceae bacterium]
MLQIKSLSKKFESFTAVDNITLSINPGDLYGFLGPNGAGKTTTIKMIVGLYAPSSGEIIINGMNSRTNGTEVKMDIGYIPDQPFLYDKLTGYEFLLFCGGLYGISKDQLKRRVNELVDLLKIEDWLNKRTEEYSQGMRQRITIASALLHKPKLIIVDEPMVGLDPQSAHVIKNVFRDYTNEGNAVFMSTHSLNVVEEICNRVGIIKKGQIIFDDAIGKLHALKQEHDRNIEELFIQLTHEEPL